MINYSFIEEYLCKSFNVLELDIHFLNFSLIQTNWNFRTQVRRLIFLVLPVFYNVCLNLYTIFKNCQLPECKYAASKLSNAFPSLSYCRCIRQSAFFLYYLKKIIIKSTSIMKILMKFNLLCYLSLELLTISSYLNLFWAICVYYQLYLPEIPSKLSNVINF